MTKYGELMYKGECDAYGAVLGNPKNYKEIIDNFAKKYETEFALIYFVKPHLVIVCSNNKNASCILVFPMDANPIDHLLLYTWTIVDLRANFPMRLSMLLTNIGTLYIDNVELVSVSNIKCIIAHNMSNMENLFLASRRSMSELTIKHFYTNDRKQLSQIFPQEIYEAFEKIMQINVIYFPDSIHSDKIDISLLANYKYPIFNKPFDDQLGFIITTIENCYSVEAKLIIGSHYVSLDFDTEIFTEYFKV